MSAGSIVRLWQCGQRPDALFLRVVGSLSGKIGLFHLIEPAGAVHYWP